MEDVQVTIDGPVARVEIHTPNKMNALREQTLSELTEAFSQVGLDPSVAVVVVSAHGPNFSAGFDANVMAGMDPEHGRRLFYHRNLPLSNMMRNIPQPIVAEVRGVCAGGGFEITLFCDLILAAEDARFCCVGVNAGITPVWGANQMLPIIVGEKRAREMVYFAKQVSGVEAARIGLANKAVAEPELRDTVDEWCARLADMSPTGIRISKRSLNFQFDQMYPALVQGLEMAATALGDEVLEGYAAFQEKRKPDWAQFRVRKTN